MTVLMWKYRNAEENISLVMAWAVGGTVSQVFSVEH